MPCRQRASVAPHAGDSGPALSGVYRLPKLDEIAGKRVVVTTCSVASLLEDVWIIETGGAGSRDPIVFTHVLVDEAGQATVPEVLMALALVRPGGTACLVGDPKQLGPIVRSPLARSRDLNVSLVRLLRFDYTCQAACPLRTSRLRCLAKTRSGNRAPQACSAPYLLPSTSPGKRAVLSVPPMVRSWRGSCGEAT